MSAIEGKEIAQKWCLVAILIFIKTEKDFGDMEN